METADYSINELGTCHWLVNGESTYGPWQQTVREGWLVLDFIFNVAFKKDEEKLSGSLIKGLAGGP